MMTPGTDNPELKEGKIARKDSCWRMVSAETFKNVDAFPPSENTLQSRASSKRGSPLARL
jgi:hypothetical protein